MEEVICPECGARKSILLDVCYLCCACGWEYDEEPADDPDIE